RGTIAEIDSLRNLTRHQAPENGRVAELADALDLKSSEGQPSCGFESRLGHSKELRFKSVFHSSLRVAFSEIVKCHLNCHQEFPKASRQSLPRSRRRSRTSLC